MDSFLKSRLGLHLHPNKKHLNRADSGIDFTGFIIKPGRTYLRQTSLSGCKRNIRAWERKGSPVDPETLQRVSQSLNSYFGMLRQVNGYRAREALCRRVEAFSGGRTGTARKRLWSGGERTGSPGFITH